MAAHDDDPFARIAALEARIEELERRSEPAASPDLAVADHRPVSRRRMLGLAGAAAAAGLGGAVAASASAGATTGNMQFGAANDAGTDPTSLTGSNQNYTLSLTNTGGGDGITSTSSGVFDVAIRGYSASGTGVRGESGTGASLYADAPTANTSGVHLTLSPGSSTGPPTAGAHSKGQFWMDVAGVLFQCVTAGTPGTWVKQAPLVTLASPVRVYDSRSGQANQAPNTQGSLTFTGAPPSSAFRDVACNKNASSGATVVPAEARTLLMNLAIVSISGVGALNAYATGTTQPATANINWFAGNQVLSNAVTSACSTTQHVNFAIVASTGAATHFIVDVIGYYL